MGRHLERAYVLFDQSRRDLAEEELRQELAEDPSSFMAHALLSLCFAERGKFAEATAEAEQSIHLAPDVAFTHYALASVMLERRDYNAAERAIDQAIQLDPHRADYFGVLAAIRINRREWQAAVEAAEAGLAIDPEHINCNNLRAVALVKLGRRDEAGATIASALARAPEDAFTHANQGWALLDQGQPQKAMEHFREALRLEPNLDWARRGIVEALKARNIVYRVMLWYFLWMAKLSRGTQWGIVLGGYFGYRVLSSLAHDNPNLAPFIWPFLIVYILFVFLSWTADSLFNLLLRLSRFGRLALSHDQIIASNWVGGSFLLALISLAIGIAVPSALCIIAAIIIGMLVLPISAVFHCEQGWPRILMAIYTLLLAGLGFTAVALLAANEDVGAGLGSLFFIGIFLSGLVANGLAMATPRR